MSSLRIRPKNEMGDDEKMAQKEFLKIVRSIEGANACVTWNFSESDESCFPVVDSMYSNYMDTSKSSYKRNGTNIFENFQNTIKPNDHGVEITKRSEEIQKDDVGKIQFEHGKSPLELPSHDDHRRIEMEEKERHFRNKFETSEFIKPESVFEITRKRLLEISPNKRNIHSKKLHLSPQKLPVSPKVEKRKLGSNDIEFSDSNKKNGEGPNNKRPSTPRSLFDNFNVLVPDDSEEYKNDYEFGISSSSFDEEEGIDYLNRKNMILEGLEEEFMHDKNSKEEKGSKPNRKLNFFK